MAASAGKSAQKTKLQAEIEYQKTVITGYQKEFGVAVFQAMRNQDTGKVWHFHFILTWCHSKLKVQFEFQKANDKVLKVEQEIQSKQLQIEALV